LVTFGTGERALRLLPLLFGIATIVVAVWSGRRWMSPIGAAVLVLLFTFGPSVSHYVFEAKHYSADTFWAALLPALAVWATEGDDVATRNRRSLIWWIAAAVGQMLANGALLVAPGCALFLVASVLRRDGRRATLVFALSGLIWLVSFGLHYQLSLRATHGSGYLRAYWASELPPASAGFVDRARWIGDRLEPLARDPAGTDWVVSLWVCAALGLTVGRKSLGAVFATVPLSAFVLSGLGVVPLYQRFVLWIVPALYVGLAMLIDRAALVIRDGYRRRPSHLALAVPVLVVACAVGIDICIHGKRDIAGRTPDYQSHLDDRAAVRWLMARIGPGDALVTTRLAWPAIWWYGNISIANDHAVGLPDGVALLQVEYVRPGSQCGDVRLREDLKRYRRVLTYFGFDAAPGFDSLLLHELDELGAIEAFSAFSTHGLAAVINLQHPAAAQLTLHEVSPKIANTAVPLDGCARLEPAKRW
jgi:hypothetical protein